VQCACSSHPKRQGIACNQALDCSRCGPRTILAAALERAIRLSNACFSKGRKRDTNRKQNGSQNQQELAGGGEARESFADRHCAASCSGRLLAELTDEVGEIVGNGLAKRVVVDRTERTPKVARPVFASFALRRCGLS
jgi:hypothetical protein